MATYEFTRLNVSSHAFLIFLPPPHTQYDAKCLTNVCYLKMDVWPALCLFFISKITTCYFFENLRNQLNVSIKYPIDECLRKIRIAIVQKKLTLFLRCVFYGLIKGAPRIKPSDIDGERNVVMHASDLLLKIKIFFLLVVRL